MFVSSEELRDKIKELFPKRSYNITNEALEELCNDPDTQDFLKWFCSEISVDNVLTEEQLKLAEEIKRSGKWLEGEELDKALEEATKDNPELLDVLESDVTEETLSASYSLLKMAHKSDIDYIQSLEKGIKKFKDIENDLDEELEKERDKLEKLKIEEKLIFEEALENTKKLDSIHRQLSDQVDQLVNVYADAFQKKGPPCVWTQLPLDLFIKHLQTYYEYLKFYIKKEFGTSTDEPNEIDPLISSIGTDHDLNLDNTNEKQNQEQKILELKSIHQKLSKAKLAEIIARARREATQAMVDYAQKIYNGGDIQMPKTPALLRSEIAELTTKRDNLEKEVAILKERQVPDAVEQYVNSKMNKILIENAKATQQRREHSIQKLKNLLSLARDHGYFYSDLLYILIELENRKLWEVIEFVTDVRNYLESEYASSSKSCDGMRKAQEAFSSPSFKNQNVFNKYFTAMMGVEDGPNSMDIAIEKLGETLEENEKLKENLTESINNHVDVLRSLDRKLIAEYDRLIESSEEFPFELEVQKNKLERKVENLQAEVLIMRNKLKEMTEKTGTLERQKDIVWQNFYADPEALKSNYEKLMAMANQNSQDN